MQVGNEWVWLWRTVDEVVDGCGQVDEGESTGEDETCGCGGVAVMWMR